MIIRRVKSYDGGNHLVRDHLQFRAGSNEKWQTVEVIDGHEAFARDLEEGIESLDGLQDKNMRKYWKDVLAKRQNSG